MNKVFSDARAACADIPDGARLFVGGFGLCGIPEACIFALRDLGPRELTIVSNNAGTTEHGLVHLLKNRGDPGLDSAGPDGRGGGAGSRGDPPGGAAVCAAGRAPAPRPLGPPGRLGVPRGSRARAPGVAGAQSAAGY